MLQPRPEQSLARAPEWPVWLVAVAVLLAATALASIWRGPRHSRKAKVLWTVVALVIPVLGPLAWFALGRERRH